MKRLYTFSIAATLAISATAQVKTALTASDTKGQYQFVSAASDTGRHQIISGRTAMTDVVSGQLSFPSKLFGGITATHEQKVGAMVVMHSSSGVTKAVTEWADYLNGIGVATFIVDSFTGRGIARTAEDQSQLNRWAGGTDALLALKLLATHRLIDSSRIGVMGFSRGATATQIAAFESIRAGLLGKDNPLMFAGHIEFYGGCAVTAKTTGKPILMLTGGAEDYQPAANCQYVKALMQAQGANIRIIEYPGAYHGFDVGFPVAYRPNVQTASKCVVIRDADTDMAYIKDSATPMIPVSPQEGDKASCGPGKGAHSGRNEDAARKSREEVKQFVADYLMFGK